MNLILSFFCLYFLTAIVNLRAQSPECNVIEDNDIGTSTPSQEGFIALLLGGTEIADRPMISVSNVEVVSLAVGTVQNRFRWASVLATYDCSGMLCPGTSDTFPRTEQFELECVQTGIWGVSNLLSEERSTPINLNLTSADLRKDCSFCLNPADRGNLLLPADIDIDPEFHCAACNSSCLTGTDGLGYCTSITAESCCNVYQPNPMDVNMCAVSCDMGYEADPPNFICERRCPVLDNPANGQVSHPIRTVDSVATYTCNSQSRITSGDEMRTCQNDSTWDGTAAVCSVIDCGTLDDPINGQVDITGTSVGSTATYTCITGYLVNGNTERECIQSIAGWTGLDPTCDLANCGNLIAPDNGSISFTETTFGSVAVYTCMDGFINIGTGMRTCQENGVWSGNEPICEVTTLEGSPRPTEGPDGGGLDAIHVAFIIIGVIFFVIMIVTIVLLIGYGYYKWTHDY